MTMHAAVSGIVLATDPPVEPIAGSAQLIIAAPVGIAVIVLPPGLAF